LPNGSLKGGENSGAWFLSRGTRRVGPPRKETARERYKQARRKEVKYTRSEGEPPLLDGMWTSKPTRKHLNRKKLGKEEEMVAGRGGGRKNSERSSFLGPKITLKFICPQNGHRPFFDQSSRCCKAEGGKAREGDLQNSPQQVLEGRRSPRKKQPDLPPQTLCTRVCARVLKVGRGGVDNGSRRKGL